MHVSSGVYSSQAYAGNSKNESLKKREYGLLLKEKGEHTMLEGHYFAEGLAIHGIPKPSFVDIVSNFFGNHNFEESLFHNTSLEQTMLRTPFDEVEKYNAERTKIRDMIATVLSDSSKGKQAGIYLFIFQLFFVFLLFICNFS